MGYFPFGKYSEDHYEIYSEILNAELEFPIHIRSKSLKDLITVLLTKDPEYRNSLKWSDIRKMEFFRGF